MDLQRDPAILKRKQRRRAIIGATLAVAVLAVSVAVSKLEPALPSVSAGTLWIRAVRRGPMVREVRGAGTLVPEEIYALHADRSVNLFDGRVVDDAEMAALIGPESYAHPRV